MKVKSQYGLKFGKMISQDHLWFVNPVACDGQQHDRHMLACEQTSQGISQKLSVKSKLNYH